MIDALITTIMNRPYVFAFLAGYLFLSIRLWNLKRSLLWLFSGYVIAWFSEYLSINYGFPYGWYFYHYQNMPGELLVAGVPFFDSLSYPFLIFAGYCMSLRLQHSNVLAHTFTASPRQATLLRITTGALFTTLLDVVIDPIAHLGSKWFLGEIYYYPNPGWYFDVPLSNFAGWFLVAAIVIAVNELLWKLLKERLSFQTSKLCTLFYFSIALFNIIITFWIGAYGLGICSSLIMGSVFLVGYKSKDN
ncbi:MAG: carotenoid biosynthesis protein [Deltaproteobacteria bacterium CG_4_10_14_0_2_um_filter_43_8]|nr:MAG: hypothetical protein COV43_05515 [Deltaproteobacteria bacterium CG11_big_fil_rev_8_21_14_0_20_42_23]PJA20268.1 MAG: carotenoid biosynthesis protein [Deltaproteobacteria bacterium CG_4_10_14_0_2_um_filter_43_8]PJC64050.1 MAG: carotenoid biosynthesis protein [Deltaproteobacteria bacterium CG_4_9_14_0_2_um_filter_42_21]